MNTDNIQEIGYAFLKTYYQRMHNDPFKVHHLYSTTAEFTHVNYQSEFDPAADTLPTTKVTGKDNISKFYTRHSKKIKSIQVKIDACDFQCTGANNSNILILALGEMCWTGTPSYRFCQTFVLAQVPSNPKIYDVTNDILRFIPDLSILLERSLKKEIDGDGALNGQEELQEEESSNPRKVEVEAPQVQEESEQEQPSSEGVVIDKEADEKSDSVPAKEQKELQEQSSNDISEKVDQETGIQSKEKEPKVKHSIETEDVELTAENTAVTPIEENMRSEKQPPKVDEAGPEREAQTAPKSTSNETMKVKSIEPEKPTAEPAKKMNWASKLAASESKDVPNITTKYIRADPVPAPVAKKTPERKSVSPNGQPKDAKNFKKKQFYFVNKDGFYPVYVRGTGGVTDEQLVRALESEFGTVKKISSQETFAVIDFEDQRCQTEAIERGVLRVNNVEVHMEPKTVRKPNASSSSSTPASGQRFGRKHNTKGKT